MSATRITDQPRAVDTRQIKADLEEAFALFQSELLGMLYYLTGSKEDAYDALQETFVKCWRSRDNVPQIENLKAWIFRIALNTARDLRTTAWRRRKKPLAGDETMIVSERPSPLEDAQRNEHLTLVREAIVLLRPEEKEVFLLRQNGEMTYEAIGRTIGIPTGTAKTRMRTALGKLRSALNPT